MTWRRFLLWFAERFPRRRILDRAGGTVYMTRYFLLGGPRDPEAPDSEADELPRSRVWSRLPFNVYLHRFHRSDDDEALHNHPWKWALSLVLSGGYLEERKVNDSGWKCSVEPSCECGDPDWVTDRVVRPGRLNVLLSSTFHRVDLLSNESWSLFIAGPKTQSWGFWDRWTGRYTPWREYIEAKRAQDEQ